MSRGLSLLIVDDDPGSLALFQGILEEVGFAVQTADTPRAALQLMEAQPPDLLLTDLRLPEMSGLDLLRAARRRGLDLCGLLITGFATPEATAEAFRAGFQDVLLKPVHAEELQARLLRAAEVVWLRREVRALRAASMGTAATVARGERATRARELHDLPAIPGSAGPVGGGGRDDLVHRLEQLGALFRHGVITSLEFEQKKRALLDRM
jgi:DNA-binding NtrC family response regulator